MNIAFHLTKAQIRKPKQYVLYIRDYLLDVPNWRRRAPAYEAAHTAKANLVLSNSSHLAQRAQAHNPRSYYVGQGCKQDFLDQSMDSIPWHLPKAKPIIGYLGFLTSLRLDISLLEQLAVQHPENQFVLAGPEDEALQQSRLHKQENVQFLGSISQNGIKAFVQACQVCINPQIVNNTTTGNYPLKIDEYLLLGKPVVATHTAAMKEFEQHVYLAKGAKDWSKNLSKAIHEHTKEKAQERIAFASTHTWENSVSKMMHHMNKHIKETRAHNDHLSA